MILGKNAIILDIEDAKKIYSELNISGRRKTTVERQLKNGTFDAIEGLRTAIQDIEDIEDYA